MGCFVMIPAHPVSPRTDPSFPTMRSADSVAAGTGLSGILQKAEAREGETMTPEWEGGEAKLRPAGSGETAGFRLVGVSQTAIRDAEGHATRFSAVVQDRKSTRLNSSH